MDCDLVSENFDEMKRMLPGVNDTAIAILVLTGMLHSATEEIATDEEHPINVMARSLSNIDSQMPGF